MTLATLIFNKLMLESYGKVNAIKRERLLDWAVLFYEPSLTDRELRRIVKTMPKICCCEDGYFIASCQEESDYSIAYLKKKVFPLWEDIRRIYEAYPEFYHGRQLELF